ncbi:helix-turn-helix domain-containing protein [Loktanella sp. S4079]|uniref:helix-turn-helix domain-containing protein n=1 Tax=Loktanella sp. S4079 TaxID=579483 RepID=UPI0005F9C0E6|nr:helix-turn-helix transcriptional regulator [Loktanella sp. S4079]KJZ17925.1 hypothetical protein TW80_16450 [Loktanella sp. S4079]
MHADIFETLKTVLRARKLTYADLAERLGLSEPTIKRIFSERDCKLSRITEICAALDLSLDDVVAQSSRIEVVPVDLGDRIEALLADNRPAFHLFLLLRDGMTGETIKAHYQLDDSTFFKWARLLEVIGLVELMPYGRVRLLDERPIRFRRGGPLHQTLRKLNMEFVEQVFQTTDREDAGFLTLSRRVSETTARHIMGELRDLSRELTDLARKDQLTLPDEALQSFKLATAWAPVDFSQLLELDDANVRE